MTINLIGALHHLPRTNYRAVTAELVNALGYMDVNGYTALFNDATFSCMESVGVTPPYLLSKSWALWSAKTFAQYIAEVNAGQKVGIYTRFIGYSRKRLHLMHFMVVEPMQYVAATYEDIIVHLDRQADQTIPWPDSVMTRIVETVKTHQQQGWEAPICGVLHPF